MKILIVGFLPIPKNITGGTQFITEQIKALRYAGHYVEIFTIFKNSKSSSNSLNYLYYGGIRYNIIYRDDTFVYFDPYNPLREIKDNYSSKLFKEFLAKRSHFDVIHFHMVYPIEFMEIAKKMGYKVFVTLHDYSYYLPFSPFLVSKSKMLDNPAADVSLVDYSPESLYKEELLNANLPYKHIELTNYKRKIEYVNYIFSDVVDSVLGNGDYPERYSLLFGTKFKRLYDFSIFYGVKLKQQYIKNNYKTKKRLIIGFVNYAAVHKGAYFLLEIVKKLKDFDDIFEVRIYGALNDKEFKEYLYQQLAEDLFLGRHIKIMNGGFGYQQRDIDKIASEVDLVFFPDNTLHGVGGVLHQFAGRGVMCINPMSLLNIIFVMNKMGHGVDEIKNYFRTKYNLDLFLDEMFLKKIIDKYSNNDDHHFQLYRDLIFLPGDIQSALDVLKRVLVNREFIEEYYKWRIEFFKKESVKQFNNRSSLEIVAEKLVKIYSI